ncbi:hypothetical protein NHJ13734_005446 [Beauveria thailandica]
MSPRVISEAQRVAIIIALEQQRQHGTMIPDQTGFVAAYDAIMNAVPEAHRREAGREIQQTIWWMHSNNNNLSLVSFDAWIERNDLRTLFVFNEPGQEHRYEPIVRDLRAKAAERQDAFLEFVNYIEREAQLYVLQTPDAEAFAKQHLTSVNRIAETALRAQLDFNKIEQSNQRSHFLTRGGDITSRGNVEPWILTDINSTMPSTPPIQVKVQNQLRGMSYYCGRHAGTYIFRLNQSTTVGSDAQAKFKFCGIVPRNRADHVARLKAIRGRVLHILVAACSYIAGYAGVSGEKSVAKMQACMDQATDGELESISRYARIYLEQGCMFRGIQEAFRSSPVLREFVYLMVMYEVKPDEIKQGQRLVELICSVAKCTKAEMVDQENSHLEQAAWYCLQVRVDVDNCLLFYDDEVERETRVPLDIHDYFSDQKFAIDPNHPEAQYRITDEAWKQLQSDYLFARSLRQRWIRDHREASILADLKVPKLDTPLLARVFQTVDSQPSSSQSTTEPAEEQPPPVKRGRGRPKGSKNKPKPPGWVPKPRASGVKRKRQNQSPSTDRNGSAMDHRAALQPSVVAADDDLYDQAGPSDVDNAPPLFQFDTDLVFTENGTIDWEQI